MNLKMFPTFQTHLTYICKMIEFMYEHAARTWAYQQKAWFGRESKVFYDAKEKRWICHVLDEEQVDSQPTTPKSFPRLFYNL